MNILSAKATGGPLAVKYNEVLIQLFYYDFMQSYSRTNISFCCGLIDGLFISVWTSWS